MNKENYVKIFDTTLRDGEQTPNASLTIEDKIEIAGKLSLLGVDVIEAGSPMSSEGERKVVKEVAKAGLEAEICALARTTKGDIETAKLLIGQETKVDQKNSVGSTPLSYASYYFILSLIFVKYSFLSKNTI